MTNVLTAFSDTVVRVPDNTPCSSRFMVSGHELYVWAIVGGTIAIAFADYSFTERKNYCARMDSAKDENWVAWGGVRLTDIEGGAETLIDFVRRNKPMYELREQRKRQLQTVLWLPYTSYPGTYVSRRFHDTDEHVYFHAHIEATTSNVCVVSSIYSGKCEETHKFMSKPWQAMAQFLTSLRAKYGSDYCGLEKLSAEDFGKYIAHARDVYADRKK